jgi:Flp pilus assembly protein TadG
MPDAVQEATQRFLDEEVGAGLVEYALIFMLFLTLLLGSADFGRALYAYHFVSNAAREATRWAAVNGSTCSIDGSCSFPNGAQAGDVQSFVTKHVPLGINSSELTVTPTWPSTAGTCATTDNAPGCTVDVQVQYAFSFTFPFVYSKTLTLTSESQTVILH